MSKPVLQRSYCALAWVKDEVGDDGAFRHYAFNALDFQAAVRRMTLLGQSSASAVFDIVSIEQVEAMQ